MRQSRFVMAIATAVALPVGAVACGGEAEDAAQGATVATVATEEAASASGLYWDNIFAKNIMSGMDTSEPPDGGMHAHNNTIGGTLGLPCPWNDEDELGISGSGDIAPGQTSDVSLCLVADLYNNPYDYPKYIYARVFAKQPGLKVWVTGEPVTLSDGRVISSSIDSVAPVSAHWTGFTGVEYQLCGADAVAIAGKINSWQDLTFWPQIPGSGGYGQIVNYTLHVQNLGKSTAHNVSGYFEIGWDDYDGAGPFISPSIQNFSQSARIDCPPRPTP